MKIYGIVGAGGFGREVLPLVEAFLKTTGQREAKLFFVQEEQAPALLVNDYPVLSMQEFFSYPAENKYFNIAIANGEIRKRIAEQLLAKGAEAFRITALNSIELGPNHIGEGAILCPFTTITANARIGRFFHANIYSYVAHDCIIGDYVTFAPNVHCNGNVHIEDQVYVGTGVVIREGSPQKPLLIGKGAILGMGAVITKNVPPFETVVGNPARPMKAKESTRLTA
ncbi:MAG TPA: acetyltransferase [Gammaproteobacteria bacterium]|nr:acetyltransferase [Gammaproteobacteria bacterium]